MKTLKLLITPILVSLILSSCAADKTEAPTQSPQESNDQTQIVQFYKDSVTKLEGELATLKEETYIMSTTYELKIRELEEYISSLKTEENTPTPPNDTLPNQNIVLENQQSRFEYSLTDSGAVITKYIGSAETVDVPSSIEGRPVTKILEYAFSETKVKSVVLPEGLCEIDWFAFYKCPFLEKIYVPSTVVSIGYGAFDYCSKSLTFYCNKDSYAEKYAASFGIPYELK